MIPSWEEFSVYLFIERKLDRANASSYKCIYRFIRDFFREKSFDKTNVNYFFATLEAKNRSNQTLNNYLKTIKHLARFMGLDFMRDYTYWKKIQPQYRVLTDDECRKLEKVYLERGNCDSEIVNNRYSVLIHLLARTGMRINEALTLKWTDIMPDRIVVRAENNKTDNMRQIPISKETYNKLFTLQKYDYVFASPKGKMDIGSINNELKLRGKFLRIKDWEHLSCHQFRHYFACSLLRSGVSIALVARLLGHSSIVTTDHYYSHYVIEDLISAVECHPLNAQGLSFQTIKEKVKVLSTQIENTTHHLHLSEKENMIILEVENGQI